MFSLYDIMAEYDLTYNELCELLENVGELTGEDTIGIICALDIIYNGEENKHGIYKQRAIRKYKSEIKTGQKNRDGI